MVEQRYKIILTNKFAKTKKLVSIKKAEKELRSCAMRYFQPSELVLQMELPHKISFHLVLSLYKSHTNYSSHGLR